MKKKYIPDISRLGAVFDSNYRRMCSLIRVLADQDRAVISLNSGEEYIGDVSIKMIESCKYTDTILLEQSAAKGKWLNNPKMTVRLYHDASVAEVISFHKHRHIKGANHYPNKFMHHPDEKAQINEFLSEWLNFCLAHGCGQSNSILRLSS